MAKRRPEKADDVEGARVSLVTSVEEARQKIATRIELGRAMIPEMQTYYIRPPQGDDPAEKFRKWHNYNIKLLEHLFTTDRIATEYRNTGPMVAVFGGMSASEEVQDRAQRLMRAISNLEHIVETLELFADSNASLSTAGTASSVAAEDRTRVFVVHGRNGEKKQEVARCIERLGLEAVILHERPNGGKTLIEKFEEFADVGFAVIVLTADDEGGIAGAETRNPRARQNVVFEMGYFCGKLTRSRVCALYESGVELPSDFQGVVYTELDDKGRWHFDLAKELRAAGYAVDLNNL